MTTMQVLLLLLAVTAPALCGPVAHPGPQHLGYGYGEHGGYGAPHHGAPHHEDPCEEGSDTILVKKCHLEPSKECSTESVVVGKKVVGHEDPVCEEVKGCAPEHHGGPGYGPPGFGFGKREAEAQYGHHGCVEVVHKNCQQGAPVEEDVSQEVETCKLSTKEVCEDVEKKVASVTCKKHEHVEHY